MPDTILRMRHLVEITGLGESTIFALIARGSFPRPIRLTPGGRAVGWRQSVIEAYLADPDAWVANNARMTEGVAA